MELLLISGLSDADYKQSKTLQEFLLEQGHTVNFPSPKVILSTGDLLSYEAVVFGIGTYRSILGSNSNHDCQGVGFNLGHLSNCRIDGTRFEEDPWSKQSSVEPPQGPFVVKLNPNATNCRRGVANILDSNELWSFGPVGFLGHVISYKITFHETCIK